MFHPKNLLIVLVLALGILMATGCNSTTETPIAQQPTVAAPAPTVAPTEAPAPTAAPTEAPAPTAAPTEEVQATNAPAFEPGTTITYIASQDWIKGVALSKRLAKVCEKNSVISMSVTSASQRVR